MKKKAKNKIAQALVIFQSLGLPKQQQNERSALILLALLNVKPKDIWADAKEAQLGITPIMDFIQCEYDIKYAPNTRETIRRQTIHQFVDAGITIANPDKPDRPVNSPKYCYQMTPDVINLIRSFESTSWATTLAGYMKAHNSLSARYAKQRSMRMIPVVINGNKKLALTPGKHSQLISDILTQFAPRYAPGSQVLYVGDTGSKMCHYDEDVFGSLGLTFDYHGKFPDVVLFFKSKNWLLLIESVTSHGPVDAKRYSELDNLFKNSTAGIVYVTAFPDRRMMAKYLGTISWETEVWVADAPTHLIHFNGDRFLGPFE